MLPPPTLTFTIPSVHDDLVLQCRVYHPTCLAPTTVTGIAEWRKRAAIVAHPYAPLGGCYDDPVVDLVASTILKQGFVVGTFNFRGAAGSKGRTSWQSKAEQNDYISFIGFMIYYLQQLDPCMDPLQLVRHPSYTQPDPLFHDLSPIPSQAIPPSPHTYDSQHLTPSTSTPLSTFERDTHESLNRKSCLILAGYSYGALITCSLPPTINSIIAPFQTPPPGSSYAEIRLRACSLASQQTNLMSTRIQSLLSEARRGRSLHSEDHILCSPKSRKSNISVRMGGEEDPRRASHESHRSRSSFTVDSPVMVRKSIDRIRSIGNAEKRRQGSRGSVSSAGGKKKKGASESSIEHVVPDEKESIKAIPGIIDGLQVAYLLISPLQGWVNTLATMWSSRGGGREGNEIPEHEMKFTVDPTLALFGDDDIFVSVKRLRSWAEKLAGLKNGEGSCQFRHREIPSAGHFWHDHEAVQVMRSEVKEFSASL